MSSAAIQNVVVRDNTVPVIRIKNISLPLVNGSARINAADVDKGSFDTCRIASLTVDKSSFDCSNIGDNTVVLTVTDVRHKVSLANAMVTIIGAKPSPSIFISRHDNILTGLDDKTIAIGYGAQNVLLKASNNTSASYAWTAADGSSTLEGAQTVFTPSKAGQYTFTVTALPHRI